MVLVFCFKYKFDVYLQLHWTMSLLSQTWIIITLYLKNQPDVEYNHSGGKYLSIHYVLNTKHHSPKNYVGHSF